MTTDRAKAGDKVVFSVERKLVIMEEDLRSALKRGGAGFRFAMAVFDRYGRQKDAWTPLVPNVMTAEGLNYYLSMISGLLAQPAELYICPFTTASPVGTWTYANGDGSIWTEWTTYDEVTRPIWVHGAVSGGVISNSASPASFTKSTGSSVTVRGAGLVTVATKGHHTAGSLNVLVNASSPGTKTLDPTDILKVQVQLSQVDDGV